MFGSYQNCRGCRQSTNPKPEHHQHQIVVPSLWNAAHLLCTRHCCPKNLWNCFSAKKPSPLHAAGEMGFSSFPPFGTDGCNKECQQNILGTKGISSAIWFSDLWLHFCQMMQKVPNHQPLQHQLPLHQHTIHQLWWLKHYWSRTNWLHCVETSCCQVPSQQKSFASCETSWKTLELQTAGMVHAVLQNLYCFKEILISLNLPRRWDNLLNPKQATPFFSWAIDTASKIWLQQPAGLAVLCEPIYTRAWLLFTLAFALVRFSCVEATQALA